MRKTWLITGSGRGLGRSIAEAVLENGDHLLATTRNVERLADLEERYGDRVEVTTFDVTDAGAAGIWDDRRKRRQLPDERTSRSTDFEGRDLSLLAGLSIML